MKSVFIASAVSLLLSGMQPGAQVGANKVQVNQGAERRVEGPSTGSSDLQAEQELKKGTALTRQGLFTDAIPHLLAAREKGSNSYAASFNLAICYVGTGEYKKAILVLTALKRSGQDEANVENLLAQAYIGNGQEREALAAFKSAVATTPQDDKLYLFVADACMQQGDFAFGLRVIEIGLGNLPQSAVLHYQRAMFLSQMDQFDRAKGDFASANQLAPGSLIGYMAIAHEALLEGNISDAIRFAREGVGKYPEDPILLTILGQALVRSGVTPGQPEFSEAQSALERSVAERPNDPASQIALGQIDLMAGNLEDAIVHLQKARQMRPDQPSVYASLAKAYQRHGDAQQAQEALATLEKLNEVQAEKIRSAPGDTKLSYGGGEIKQQDSSPHP